VGIDLTGLLAGLGCLAVVVVVWCCSGLLNLVGDRSRSSHHAAEAPAPTEASRERLTPPDPGGPARSDEPELRPPRATGSASELPLATRPADPSWEETPAPAPPAVSPPAIVVPAARSTLLLRHSAPIVKGAEVWVEVDGRRAAEWPVGQREVRVRVDPGERHVRVVSDYRGVKRIVLDERVSVPPDRTKEVMVNPPKAKK